MDENVKNQKNNGADADEIASIGEPTQDERIPALEADLAKAKNDYLYLAAEFDTYKRAALKERAELIKFGPERLVRDLLDIVDNFERALTSEAAQAAPESFKQGIEMVDREMKSAFAKYGIVEVECLGQPFDPSLHEALASEESEQYQSGQVSKVFKKGYKIHDRLLRPAQVVVAK